MKILERPRSIADSLRNGDLTEQNKLNFYWVLFGLQSIFGQNYLNSLLQILVSPLGAIVHLMPLGISIWGILACFRANRRGDNCQFLERFICLFASLAIRIYPLYFLLYFALQTVGRLLPGFSYSLQVLLFVVSAIVTNALWLYMYIRLRKLMVYVASTDNT